MTETVYTTSISLPNALSQPLVYEGEIIHDHGEMLSLTDMWRAAGAEEHRAPAKWRALPATKSFVEHVAVTVGKSDSDIFNTQIGGRNPGTWAHWQIALAYAKYLNPQLHMWCNTVVRERMNAQSGAVGYVVIPVAQIAVASEAVFKSYFGIAQTIGLDINQSALAANRATRSLTGQNPLQLLGYEQLEAPRQEQHLTPTDIGKQVGGHSARSVNAILESIGMQTSGRDAKGNIYWEPTPEGKAFSVMLDTNKKHSDGTPICQLKWRSGIVAQVRAALEA